MYEERRYAAVPAAVEGKKIVGYAAIFNSRSEAMPIGKDGKRTFREFIRPGAFAESLRSKADVMARFEHDSLRGFLGRVSNGTLRLTEDHRGLRYEIDPPDTSAARDVVELIRRGDVRHSSFAFTIRAGGESWQQDVLDRNGMIRELRSVALIDVAPVTVPAYPATEAALRSFEAWQEQHGMPALAEMRLRLAEAV